MMRVKSMEYCRCLLFEAFEGHVMVSVPFGVYGGIGVGKSRGLLKNF
ncbi:MAG: hypothetical protein R3B95_10060 [Nitrospirales bacterium]|nr:hypothetical protein [Nitrospirales bacterium]